MQAQPDYSSTDSLHADSTDIPSRSSPSIRGPEDGGPLRLSLSACQPGTGHFVWGLGHVTVAVHDRFGATCHFDYKYELEGGSRTHHCRWPVADSSLTIRARTDPDTTVLTPVRARAAARCPTVRQGNVFFD